jgi:hypothetical protein
MRVLAEVRLARYRWKAPAVIKSDPDGNGKACNKGPAWPPPGKPEESPPMVVVCGEPD